MEFVLIVLQNLRECLLLGTDWTEILGTETKRKRRRRRRQTLKTTVQSRRRSELILLFTKLLEIAIIFKETLCSVSPKGGKGVQHPHFYSDHIAQDTSISEMSVD